MGKKIKGREGGKKIKSDSRIYTPGGTSNLEVPHLDKQEGDIFLKLNVPKMECKRRKIKEGGGRRRSS